MTSAGALGEFLVATLLQAPAFLRGGVVVAVLLLALAVLPAPPLSLVSVERLVRSRWAAPLIGVISAAAMWFVWTSLHHPPIVQDEEAYLLQAHLFAAGRWADPAPPIPEFFEQPHVLVVPELAAKYPPGHALLLAAGVRLGRPGLVPVLLLGLTGALVFALARDAVRSDAGPWAAVLAWVGWLGIVGHDSWQRPSYMSEITTSALWVLGWWAVLRWRDRKQVAYLLLLAACIGWGAITRPLTMLAYAIPVGAVVVVLAFRRRAWRHVVAALAVGLAVLAIIPLWSRQTTGHWSETPLGLYTAQYLPWDIPGFGFRDTPPTRALHPEIACFPDWFGNPRHDYGPAQLPRAFAGRLAALTRDTFTEWRSGLALFALAALVVLPVELAVALGTCLLLVIAYLSYAHDPNYTLYYMETQTTAVTLVALGIVTVALTVGRRWARRCAGETASEAGRRIARLCTLALVVIGVLPTMWTLRGIRRGREIGDLPHQMFRDSVRVLPPRPAIVFVHFAPGEGCGGNMIENSPPLATARAWIVYDRGKSDDQLVRLAPDRLPYLFDTKTWQMRPYRSDSDTTGAASARRERGRPGHAVASAGRSR